MNSKIGIIGGTGLYDLEGFTDQQWLKVSSNFGNPSDRLLFGKLNDHEIVFLPRHARGHTISPSDINYRANIEALKNSGVDRIISLSAVGSLNINIKPGSFVIVDQYIDRTYLRQNSFFEKGFVVHVSMAEPTCKIMNKVIYDSAKQLNIKVHDSGTYVVIEGPQFSTKAESNYFRKMGADIIGMTNMPEAKLAREAEIPYSTIALVTDYDCWHDDHENVSTNSILDTLSKNTDNAKKLISKIIPIISNLKAPFSCGSHNSLEHAVATSKEYRDEKEMKKISNIAGRIIDKKGWNNQ
ncbi:MAG: S-methyl-5'-thioadenosine phosphorylase [Chloroflexi bacterium]|nr:S-methyl-5'-thioadenosine phosphorylase [Chloroflexota bacterium]